MSFITLSQKLCSLLLDSTTQLYSYFTNHRGNQRWGSHHLALLLYCLCQRQGITLNMWYWKPQQMKWSRNGSHVKKKRSLDDEASRSEICRHSLIFQHQSGWLRWSICVYEVNSRLKYMIYHFGSLNQRQREAYFFLENMKCLFSKLFTRLCLQVVSRINVSGWVNYEISLWWVCVQGYAKICFGSN